MKFKMLMIFAVIITPIYAAAANSEKKQPQHSGFLTAKGTMLYLDGKEFREVGFNKFDLFWQTVMKEDGPWKEMTPSQIEGCLADLQKHGFRMIRVACSPYYFNGFEQRYFDSDPEVQKTKRKVLFDRFDAMLDMCDRYNIIMICSLVWSQDNLADLGRHSLHEAFTNPDCLGRKRVREYIGEVVTRYKDRPTIAMWEFGNEWNLGADQQRESGVAFASTETSLIRDKRNNFTSKDLADTVRDMAIYIKSIDSKHLITSGYSAPRPYAMHIFEAAKNGKRPDETLDTKKELETYLAFVHPDPIDVIQIHYYEDAMRALGKGRGDASNIKLYKEIADKIGKPLIIGEIGLYQEMDPGIKDYHNPSPETISYIQNCLDAVVENEIPATLYWTYCDDAHRGEENWSLRYGAADQVLEMIEKANFNQKKQAASKPIH